MDKVQKPGYLEFYLNNAHTLDEFKHNICETVTSLEVSKLKLASTRDFKFKMK
jgi:hypothetical protein